MFEFLFKYPPRVFTKGTFVLLGSWPHWVLYASIVGLALLLGFAILRKRSQLPVPLRGARTVTLWILQSALAVLLLLLLWEPAISVAALKPHENIIAVVVDNSRSMSIPNGAESRQQQAIRLLNATLLKKLQSRFQVRLYELGNGVQRIGGTEGLKANEPASQIGRGLQQLAEEAQTLPIGAVVLLTDGADTTGGITRDTLSDLQRAHLPVNAIGFGTLRLSHDVELESLDIPAQALVQSRLEARVNIRQNGFTGQRATLTLTGSGKVLAAREIVLKNTPQQTETLEFNAGDAGVKLVDATLHPLPGENNQNNNRLNRNLEVDGGKRRILYIEGEPRWEYKFLRRAVEDDPALQVVSMLRTTQNKIYRQGVSGPSELADGFPSRSEDLFRYQGLILGSIESGFFTKTQQELIREFADRRGGGVLFLGGRAALADGDYDTHLFAELLPVVLPKRKKTFQRTLVAAELTDAGRQSMICRIEDDSQKSADHWEILPYLADYQDPGTPKPGAVVLARMDVGGKRLPLLITENYGRGRTGVFATGGSWRWRMQQPVVDTSQETFWRQLLRWLVGATPSRVVASMPSSVLEDDGHTVLQAEVRDADYVSTNDATVKAHVIAPDGSAEDVALAPEPMKNGVYSAEWNAAKPGSYVADLVATRGGQELGRDVLSFARENGVAENFHTEQNRDLLERLASATGGRYYAPEDANSLADEISYSDAGISAREIKDLWDMPAVFITLLVLLGSQWLLRRKWGAI